MNRVIFALALTAVSFAQEKNIKKYAVDVQKDIAYGKDELQKFDAYLPKNFDGDAPIVILLHGGSWRAGDRGNFEDYGNKLAELGFAAFSVEYRLAPQHHFDEMYDDCLNALRYIRKNAKGYRVNAEKAAVVGASAGGHLATMMGVREEMKSSDPELEEVSAKVTCVVNFYGPCDLRPWGNLTLPIIQDLVGKAPKEDKKAYDDVSPCMFYDKSDAPVLVLQGTADMTVMASMSKKTVQKMKEAGMDAEIILYEKEDHGFNFYRKTKNYQKAFDDMIAFLRKRLSPK